MYPFRQSDAKVFAPTASTFNAGFLAPAGLRVLLGSVQTMEDKGDMVVRNITQPAWDIFDITGFNLPFNIE